MRIQRLVSGSYLPSSFSRPETFLKPPKQRSISGNDPSVTQVSSDPQEPPPSCKLRLPPLSSSSSPSSLSSFTHSAAAPSAPQLSRSTALSHNSAHTRTHAQLPAVSHTAHRLFHRHTKCVLCPGMGGAALGSRRAQSAVQESC